MASPRPRGRHDDDRSVDGPGDPLPVSQNQPFQLLVHAARYLRSVLRAAIDEPPSPRLHGASAYARIVVSEPIGGPPGAWNEVRRAAGHPHPATAPNHRV